MGHDSLLQGASRPAAAPRPHLPSPPSRKETVAAKTGSEGAYKAYVHPSVPFPGEELRRNEKRAGKSLRSAQRMETAPTGG